MTALAALPAYISGHATAVLSAGGGGEGFKDKYPLGPQSFVFKSMWDFTIFGLTFHVTRLVTMMLTATFLIIVFYLLASRHAKIVPNRLQFIGESIYGFIRNGVAREVIGPEQGLKFAPYLTCLFSFILFLNLYEILPLAQTPVTGCIAIPGVLAVISWAMFNYVGIKKHGAGAYFKEMCFPPGVPKPLYVLLTPIEIFSTLIARPFTLAVRLLIEHVRRPPAAPGVHDGHALPGHPAQHLEDLHAGRVPHGRPADLLRAAGHRDPVLRLHGSDRRVRFRCARRGALT